MRITAALTARMGDMGNLGEVEEALLRREGSVGIWRGLGAGLWEVCGLEDSSGGERGAFGAPAVLQAMSIRRFPRKHPLPAGGELGMGDGVGVGFGVRNGDGERGVVVLSSSSLSVCVPASTNCLGGIRCSLGGRLTVFRALALPPLPRPPLRLRCIPVGGCSGVSFLVFVWGGVIGGLNLGVPRWML